MMMYWIPRTSQQNAGVLMGGAGDTPLQAFSVRRIRLIVVLGPDAADRPGDSARSADDVTTAGTLAGLAFD